MKKSVLVVDDDLGVCWAVQKLMAPDSVEVLSSATASDALSKVSAGFVGVVVLDLNLPDESGEVLFDKIRELQPEIPVIFLTGFATTDVALSLIQKGAFDFIEKSHLKVRLNSALSRAFSLLEEKAHSVRMLGDGFVELAFSDLITESPEMRAVFRTLKSVLSSKVTVLIEGESGTGKELVARGIHNAGKRKGKPFVALNCAGIPETLLEAELFGYERGAFTGAVQRKIGRYELAHDGTLFLDEIGELQPNIQAKMLRLLENGEYQRLGGLETLNADVRLVSATHRRLDKEVAENRFRDDLYYRLAVFKVQLPALRDRTGDIKILTDHFLRAQSEIENRIFEGIDSRALELLQRYHYPGNVRELRNILSHAVVSSNGPYVTISDLPQDFLRSVKSNVTQGNRSFIPSSYGGFENHSPSFVDEPGVESGNRIETFSTLKEIEQKHISDVYEAVGRNKTEAARVLGINRVTLYRKLKEYDIA